MIEIVVLTGLRFTWLNQVAEADDTAFGVCPGCCRRYLPESILQDSRALVFVDGALVHGGRAGPGRGGSWDEGRGEAEFGLRFARQPGSPAKHAFNERG